MDNHRPTWAWRCCRANLKGLPLGRSVGNVMVWVWCGSKEGWLERLPCWVSAQPTLAQVLDVLVVVQPVHRALAAIARGLDAAEGSRLGGQGAFVDAHDAAVQGLAHTPDARRVLAVEVGGQAVGGAVGQGQHLGLGLKARHRHHRAEGLFAGAFHVRLGVGEHGGGVVGGARGVGAPQALAAGAYQRALGHGILHMSLDFCHGTFVDHGADLRTRLRQTQVWPPLRNLATISPSTAASRSASSNTMKGALPPSSSESFLSVLADSRARWRPTGVLPVKLILRTRSSASHTSTTSGVRSREAVTRFSTPAGRPASWASLARARAVSGVSSAGLATTVQPAARAGAILRAIMAAGKFQGVITATTPTGSRTASRRLWRAGVGMTSPLARVACSANHST